MVSEALRQVMLTADGAGELDGAEILSGRAEHPVCGDEIELDLRLEAGLIADLAWRAQGCPATMVVVAAARRAVCGQTLDQAGPSLRRRVADLGGLARTEQHALGLFERALAQAVRG